jgi:hypothetical protein
MTLFQFCDCARLLFFADATGAGAPERRVGADVRQSSCRPFSKGPIVLSVNLSDYGQVLRQALKCGDVFGNGHAVIVPPCEVAA